VRGALEEASLILLTRRHHLRGHPQVRGTLEEASLILLIHHPLRDHPQVGGALEEVSLILLTHHRHRRQAALMVVLDNQKVQLTSITIFGDFRN